MRNRKGLMPWLVMGLMVLSGCSGKSDPVLTTNNTTTDEELPVTTSGSLSGTAAIGAPLAKSAVTIYGSGCEKSGTTNIHGVFTIGLGTCAGPYLVKVEGSLGTVYSLATDDDVGDIVNASPLTSLVTSLVLGSNDLSNANGTTVASVTGNSITVKVDIVKKIVQPLLSEFGVESKDIMKGSFKANGQGLDRVLDAIAVVPATGTDLKLKLKDGTDVTVPANVDLTSATTLATSVTNAVTNISSAMDALDEVQRDITAALRLIAARGDISPYCHADFLDSELEGNAGCLDYMDATTATLKVSRPVILEKVSATHFWVAFDVFIKETGETEFSLARAGVVMPMKKNTTSGLWQLYGNQVEYDVELYPSVMAIDSGASVQGYYFGLGGNTSLNNKPIQLKFHGNNLVSGSDLTIDGTLDIFGQFRTTDVSDQLCDPTAVNSNYSWHCLKGLKVSGALFNGQFTKVTATYPDPANSYNPKTTSFFIQTPKDMSVSVPTVTLTGTNGTVTTGCKASISKATWTETTGKIKFDSLDPVWLQGGNFLDLGDDRVDQSGDFLDSEKTFSPALVPVDVSFDPDAAFEVGYQLSFVDIFDRSYIRFVTCE